MTAEQIASPIDCTPIVRVAIERYICARIEMERRGGANKRQLEECRSYAVEVMHAIFFENPTLCDYRRRMDAIAVERNRK